MNKYDIAIIGSGPGGYVAAITAAQLGKKVCIIEKDKIGGVCLNVGCIPTKSLIATATLLEKIKHVKDLGINISGYSIDFPAIIEKKQQVINHLKKGIEGLLKANNITVYDGKASFINDHELNIEGNENIKIFAEKIIIATGSTPAEIPKFPFDGKFIHSSTTILDLEKPPKNIAIIGGGYIGCEFASFFNAIGSKVTIIETKENILESQDEKIIKSILASFQKKGIEVLTSTCLKDIEKNSDHLILKLDSGKNIKTDICLMSVGRKINTRNLKLENSGVKTGKTGNILINEKMQTNIPHIYAIGDVTGNWMLAHVASHEGIVAAKNAAGKEEIIRYEAVPSVIFTIPEIASVGLTKKEAEEKGLSIRYSTFPISYLGKAQSTKETEGFVSIIIDTETNQILGAHMFGHDASTMISEMALAINNELTLKCVIDTIHAHPTLSEAWFEAALLANKTPIHHPPEKK